MTNSSRNGVTPTAISAKSQFEPEHQAEHADDRQQIDQDAERRATRRSLWIVATSVVIVLSRFPVWCVS